MQVCLLTTPQSFGRPPSQGAKHYSKFSPLWGGGGVAEGGCFKDLLDNSQTNAFTNHIKISRSSKNK